MRPLNELVVTDDNARDDRIWFADNPARKFRARTADGRVYSLHKSKS